MPFGDDANDLEIRCMSEVFTRKLMTLMQPKTLQAPPFEYHPERHEKFKLGRLSSFNESERAELGTISRPAQANGQRFSQTKPPELSRPLRQSGESQTKVSTSSQDVLHPPDTCEDANIKSLEDSHQCPIVTSSAAFGGSCSPASNSDVRQSRQPDSLLGHESKTSGESKHTDNVQGSIQQAHEKSLDSGQNRQIYTDANHLAANAQPRGLENITAYIESLQRPPSPQQTFGRRANGSAARAS